MITFRNLKVNDLVFTVWKTGGIDVTYFNNFNFDNGIDNSVSLEGIIKRENTDDIKGGHWIYITDFDKDESTNNVWLVTTNPSKVLNFWSKCRYDRTKELNFLYQHENIRRT